MEGHLVRVTVRVRARVRLRVRVEKVEYRVRDAVGLLERRVVAGLASAHVVRLVLGRSGSGVGAGAGVGTWLGVVRAKVRIKVRDTERPRVKIGARFKVRVGVSPCSGQGRFKVRVRVRVKVRVGFKVGVSPWSATRQPIREWRWCRGSGTWRRTVARPILRGNARALVS